MSLRRISFFDTESCLAADVGSEIVLRDFSPFIKKTEDGRIGWSVRNYRLLDSTPGKMLYLSEDPGLADVPVSEIDFGTGRMPSVIDIPLPMTGRYAITAYIPLIGGVTGVDLALDGSVFTSVMPEFGARRGRRLAESGREYRIFWKNVLLDHSVLHIRIPFGTFSATLLLSVSAALSAIVFRKLPPDADLSPVTGRPDKDFILFDDGFSNYATYGIPEENFALRLDEAFDGSDVRIIMNQINGALTWKSDLNSYLGEGLEKEDFEGKRTADVRAMRYVGYGAENGIDRIRQQAEDCHRRHMELHFSIRANLYFDTDTKFMRGNDYMNGRWWACHPEYRLPDSNKVDFAKKEVRAYYLSVFREALERFDADGINLDLTRWPKCLDSKYHSPQLLLTICREMRELADEIGKKKGRHICCSLSMVENYHSHCSLADQAIDFEAVASSGTMDFLCLESLHPEKYCAIAHRHHVKLISIIDMESPYYDNNDDDPVWPLPDDTVSDDPCAGEEFRESRYCATVPAPFEFVRQMNDFYAEGADGIAKVNSSLHGSLYFRDCGHAGAVKDHAERGTLFGQEAGDYIFLFT
ncbi:MAG: hypothetical protein IJR83_04760 [Clostridia bacterium]|nr:hypothetical protein [Clostridia bacterium]